MSIEPSNDARFREVFAAHRDDVWRFCARRLPGEEAQDAVADAFVVVWRRIDEVPAGGDSRLWVFGIARNVVRNRQRSTRRRRRLTARLGGVRSADAPSADAGAEQRSEHRALLTAVDELADDDRELLRLRCWEELSLAQIAAVTGLSVRAVESRLARVRSRLGRTLAADFDSVDRSDPGAVTRLRSQSAKANDRSVADEMWLSPTRDQGGER